MNKKKVQNNKNEDRVDLSRWYPQEYREKSDELVDRAELIKTKFNEFLDNTRALYDNTPLKRVFFGLDDAEKEELIKCRKEWDLIMDAIDYIESNVKRITNELLFCFQGNESGKVKHTFYMIHVPGYEDEEYYDGRFLGTEVVPDILALDLFDLQMFFMLLASCSIMAWKTRQEIISIYNNKPQKMEDRLNEAIKPFRDYLENYIKGHIDDIKKRQERIQESIEQTNNSQKEIKDNQKEMKKLIINRNEIDEEKTGTLSVDQCIILIGKIQQHYVDLRITDCRSVGIPPETVSKVNEKTIKRYIEYWDQYLKGDKIRGRKPPRKEYTRNMSVEDFSKLFNAIEYDKYIKWRAKHRIVALNTKRPNQFGRQ